MLKILIIIFLSILAALYIIPKVKRNLELKERLRKRKAFGEKMKRLEIK